MILLNIGGLTRTCKSTRRHAEEMISNIRTLQHAYQHLNDPNMNDTFRQQLLLLVPGKKNIDKNIIYGHHKTNKPNSLATILFPQNTLTFFNKLQIGNLKFCTYMNAVSKHGDDSTILFRTSQNILYMGRIQSIFTVIETNEIFLLIEYPIFTDYFTCPLSNGSNYRYSYIQSCTKKNFTSRLIKPTDVIEKCVYFEHPSGKCQFMRFPNLQHSS